MAESRTARFTPESLTRRPGGVITVETTLRHFAILTYAVAPEALARHLPARFAPDTVVLEEGERALISVVPFYDLDFRLSWLPYPRFAFGQTNYRAYMIDRETGQRCVWFFGTCLGSWTVAIPRYLWRLPWHGGRFSFDCAWSEERRRYTRYALETRSEWSPTKLEFEDSGRPPEALAGFPDLETALVVLTHPLTGYYVRRDGRLGSYSIWHDRLQLSTARCVHARVPLLEKLGLVTLEQQATPHSVLIQHETDFTIYLPPRPVQ
ncbi:hypothetical protein ABI59_20845 [Acidobacteria bacterium Mor1]|nr:hypothetical protein ABI59_20845 [Acidobacteria bacterium Mor1]